MKFMFLPSSIVKLLNINLRMEQPASVTKLLKVPFPGHGDH